MNVVAISNTLDQSMTIMTNSESRDAILYLGTPFDSSDAARKTALIAEGLGFYSKNKFHICVNSESVNGEVGSATLADSRFSFDGDGLVNIPGALTIGGRITSSGGIRITGGAGTTNNRPYVNMISTSSLGSYMSMGLNNNEYWQPLNQANDGTLRSNRIISGTFNYQTVNAQGFVTFHGGANTSSNALLKDLVEDIPEEASLSFLRSVSAKTYVRNDMEGTDRRCGFIAQEVEASAHESLGSNVVGSVPDYSPTGDTSNEGPIKTLSYERMSIILWQCCRNLLTRIEALETKLNSP